MARHAALILALWAVTVLAYAPVRSHPFVYEDAQVRTMMEMPIAWHLGFPSRLIAQVSYHLTDEIGPTSWPHVGNLAVHLVNGALVYALAATLVGGIVAPIAAGAFLLHPLNSEAVNYLAARPDLLLTGFILLAVVIALQPWGAWRWAVVAIALILAALTKEAGVIGLPLVAVTLWLQESTSAVPRRLWGLIAIGLLLAGTLYAPIWISSWRSLPMPPETFVRIQQAALWQFLPLTISWSGFTIDHDPEALGLALQTLATCASILVVLVLAIETWRLLPRIAWGVGWIGLSVVLRFVWPSTGWITEHHLYLGSVGAALLLGLALSWLIQGGASSAACEAV